MTDTSRNPYDIKDHYYMYDIGWIIDNIKNVQEELSQAIDLRTIHYADPIEWDITTQYQANTVVVDNKTGTAYISSKNVPAGVLLTDTAYWNVIFNYNDAMHIMRTMIAYDEQKSPTATKAYEVGQFLWSDNQLYTVIKIINKADALVVGTNIKKAVLSDKLLANYDIVAERITLAGTNNTESIIIQGGDLHVYDSADSAIKIIKAEED